MEVSCLIIVIKVSKNNNSKQISQSKDKIVITIENASKEQNLITSPDVCINLSSPEKKESTRYIQI